MGARPRVRGKREEGRGLFRRVESILHLMKSLLDDELDRRSERVAPAHSRRRPEFVPAASLKALWEAEERATAEAYARQPDAALEEPFDLTAWEDSDAL
jgi:hypothetical protein